MLFFKCLLLLRDAVTLTICVLIVRYAEVETALIIIINQDILEQGEEEIKSLQKDIIHISFFQIDMINL